MAIKHVATGVGSDSNGGNSYPGDAYATLFKGLTNIGPNDLLKVYAGDYFETINSNTAGLTIPAGTSWSDAPLIQVNAGDTVRLLVGGGAVLVNLVHTYIKYVEFDGFQFLGVNGSEISVLDNVVNMSSATYVRLRNCVIRGAKGTGLFASKGSLSAPYSLHHEFLDCEVTGNGFDFGGSLYHGMYISASDILVRGGSVHGNAGLGIQAYSSTGDALQNRIIDSVRVYGNSQDAASHPGVLISNGSLGGDIVMNCPVYDEKRGIVIGNKQTVGAQIVNNMVDGCSITGIHVDNVEGLNHDGNFIRNNLITNNTSYGLDIDAGNTDTTHGNNLYYGNGTDIRDNGTATVAEGSNVTADPLYTNRAGKDFTPASGSPAINAGQTIVAVTIDFNEISRPQGAAYDIGPYEFPVVSVTDAGNSTVSSAPSSALADGVSSSTITVTLLDAVLAPVVGHTVTLDDGAASSTIGAASGPSDSNGQVTFEVTNTTVEVATYTATDTTDAVVITETDTVDFMAVSSGAVLRNQQELLYV